MDLRASELKHADFVMLITGCRFELSPLRGRRPGQFPVASRDASKWNTARLFKRNIASQRLNIIEVELTGAASTP
jgi:hypothetical protein